MAILWLLYILFINIFKKASAHARHGIALLMLATGACWSGISFTEALFFPGHIDAATWLGDWIMTPAQPGSGLFAGISRLLEEALPYCSFAYLLVLFCLFIRYSGQYLYSRRLKGNGLSRIQPQHRLFVEETRQLMGVRKKVQVSLSSLVEGPVTLGYFKPMILIPIATASQLSIQQIEAILLHELAHIRRNDYLLNLGVAALEILFFFNPFSRLLIRDIKIQREHRCDDWVMQFRYDPQSYVAALLSLATSSAQQGRPQLALAATGGNDQLLLQRVKRILNMPGTHDRPGARALLFLFFTLSITCFAGLGLGRPAAVPIAERSAERRPDVLSAIVATESAGPRIISVALLVRESINPPGIVRRPAPTHPKCKPTPIHPGSLEAPDDEDPGYLQVSEKDADEYETSAASYATATLTSSDRREYSISTAVTATRSPSPTTAGKVRSQDLAPFVPNSSWSYKYVQDSARPEQQFVYLQKLAYQDAAIAVKRMQKELQLQLHILQLSHSPAEQQELKEKRQILEEQLQLQQEYLRKQQDLQTRFERASTLHSHGKKQRKIVVI